ncbi:hypothetical protein TRFO_06700 [Tritrichomonas foetus]|uniref:EF hand family protein n=1 Tax=Tritrichomonas foetus TaxID=1144522 RepID=A0A1J4K131_9EUKA|nr:hypothetical protein TRFO_06700 [Tritrichomonas foetus]|eukprot:OHT03452.1 hypothetical protein TRFO_06700 [Tritrichomonas foetus]
MIKRSSTDEECFDYPKLIEVFRNCDSQDKGYLTKSQYKRLVRELNLNTSKDFVDITYNAMRKMDNNTNNTYGIFFEDVKAIFEASTHRSAKTKLNSLILFRGVDDDNDGKINKSQFQKIAILVDKKLNEDEVDQIFIQCQPDSNGNVKYSNVARKLFSLTINDDVDPYTQNMRSTQANSYCCLMI